MKKMTIEKCPDKHYYVEFLVVKNFIAVIKKHHMYPNFRGCVGTNTNNCISLMYKNMKRFEYIISHQSKENVFRDAKDIGEMLKLISIQCGGRCGADFDENQSEKLQRHITHCINMLLHVFIERYNNNFEMLSEMGGEIFNMTCKEIFGVNFVDLTRPSQKEIDQLKKIHELVSSGRLQELSPEAVNQLRGIMGGYAQMYPNIEESRLNNDRLVWEMDNEDLFFDEDEVDEVPF